MLLAVDVGNTNIVFGIFRGDNIVSYWRIATDKTKTSDEYGVIFRNLVELNDIDPQGIDGSIISCVVPTLLEVIVNTLKSYFNVDRVFVVGPGIKTRMPILYHNPKEVGADRIVNAVAAYEEFKRSTIVVDFGTATTFDCISEKGEYLGGAITPGLFISAEALFSAASKLPRVEIEKPERVIGKTTVESIQSGIVYGYSGLIDGIVEKIKMEMKMTPGVVATGGFARLIANESRAIERVDEFLTLKGLRIIYEWNV